MSPQWCGSPGRSTATVQSALDRKNKGQVVTLTRADIEKVSLLARLRLSPDELDQMTSELGQVVQYVEQLGQLKTEGIEPMAHVMDLTNVFAEDALGQSLQREEALANAPKRDDACYRVPAVLGD